MEFNQNKIKIILIVILVGITFFVLTYFVLGKFRVADKPGIESNPAKPTVEMQAEQLKKIRENIGAQTLSEEELQKQAQELEKIERTEYSEEDLEKQAEELNKLRQLYK